MKKIDMNDDVDVYDSDFDSLLVLLPGSAIASEGIRLLSEISKFDDFIIQNKLKMKLPHILCPVCSSDVAGSIGALLESLRINFLAVKKHFFAQPFNPFQVTSCGFGQKQSRFFSHQSSFVEIYNEEKILLLEGRYRTSDLNVGNISGGNALSAVKQKKVKSVHSMDVRTYRFVMLYQVMDPDPLVFIDQCMDYSFLGSAKKMTVPANFDVLKIKLEKTFGYAINSEMRQHEYLLQQVQDLSENENKTKGFSFKRNQGTVITEISNESAANQISQLLFFKWCRDNGWINRIMPQVS